MINPFGVIESKNSNLISISEKPIYKSTINAGVYVISKKLITFLKKDSYMEMTNLFELGVKNKKLIPTPNNTCLQYEFISYNELSLWNKTSQETHL